MPFFTYMPAGMDAHQVSIEVRQYRGLPVTNLVGLGDTSVKESRERIRSAMASADLTYPRGRILINLSPASLRKSGPHFDLPIALALLSLEEGFALEHLSRSAFFGELSLDGHVRPVSNILNMVYSARRDGLERVFVPIDNRSEASLVDGVDVYPVEDLATLIAYLRGNRDLERTVKDRAPLSPHAVNPFRGIVGQPFAKRALLVAATGSHHVIFDGPPGVGKSLLSKTLPMLLPQLTEAEWFDVMRVYSCLPDQQIFNHRVRSRPFRLVTPHITPAALLGGGNPIRPGEVSLAHHGVLFVDELGEFSARVLDQLRVPLESGQITLHRSHRSTSFPCHFLFCGAMNPCPCGYAGFSDRCRCSPSRISRYRSRLSGPFLDRIDLWVSVDPVGTDLFSSPGQEVAQALPQAQVELAIARQRERFSSSHYMRNSEIPFAELDRLCPLSPPAAHTIRSAVKNFSLSVRAYHRLRLVSRTIADLSDQDLIDEAHVLEALQYRSRSH